ncbi:electron transfer flavoprotein subunit beta/FixA family protein [Paenibacillus sp. GXUN7292]|uniref:electron transfer flavoprotein subunit beta/FixA family protein n=1 Tax=Paenibacillus sp. GXUN7292 TaxID=3422499 RepID=UPI003D7C866B
MQRIVVLLKQTFDTEEKILFHDDGSIDDREAKLVINPYDEYALEEAIRQKEQHGGTVTVITCGNEKAEEALRTALAIGADEAIRLAQDKLPDDSFELAKALAAAIEPLQPDLLLAGLFAVDSGSGSVALQVAQRLQIPHASAAVKLAIRTADQLEQTPITGASHYAVVEQDIEGDAQTAILPLPALITAQQGLNEPRYPSLPNIMKAKRKPLHTVQPDAGSVPARTLRTRLMPKPPRAAGIRLEGDARQQALSLVSALQNKGLL